MNQQGDVLGKAAGDIGEDVSTKGFENAGLATHAHEDGLDAVGGGVIEDGVGDFGADNVDGDHGDVGFAADFGGFFEDGERLLHRPRWRVRGFAHADDVDLTHEHDHQEAIKAFGVFDGEVEEGHAAAGGDEDFGFGHVELFGRSAFFEVFDGGRGGEADGEAFLL